ncbi:hypothetical protein ACFPK5_24845 [Streptomyces beijiangensis]|uniref:DUF7848 domain-containing protein n=1 Tax=Streptomyces beijiangensis TaxID=163361 RepID=UPI00360E5A23
MADWSLGVDLSGSGPIFEAECTTCAESSGAKDGTSSPEEWCLQHAGRTGHTGYRGMITSFFRATCHAKSAS